MPPVTRNSKTKPNVKTEPYSKENRRSEKRTALNIVTNNDIKTVVANKTTKVEIIQNSIQTILKNDIEKTKRKKVEIEQASMVTKLKCEIPKPIVTNKPKTRSNSNEVCLSLNDSKNNTLYQSANEASIEENVVKSEDLYTTAINTTHSSTSENNHTDSELYHSTHSTLQESNVNSNEEELFEIDQLDWNNFMYMGCYARDIFKYLRQREDQFNITDYIGNQSELTPKHRAIIVNWLVTLQDVYGLNHEVLYMAVKLIDLYLMKHETPTDKFQLLASGALLLSCKIDEREPGLPFDLVKLSKYIYTEDELFETEREVARALDYDINVPLSYVFLRRFARCMKCQMVLLTLARYILESSLLDYKFVTTKDSLKAAAALYLAFKMCFKSVNSNEFYKYTGYDIKEIKSTIIALNNMLHTPNPDLPAIKQKYMHQAFYKVASKSLLNNSKLIFD